MKWKEIFTLVIIGHLNTNNGNTTFNNFHSSNLIKLLKATDAKQSFIKGIINSNISERNNEGNNDPATTTTQLPVSIDLPPSSNTTAYLPTNDKLNYAILENKNNAEIIENNGTKTSLQDDNVITPSSNTNDINADEKSEPQVSNIVSNSNKEISPSIKKTIKKTEPKANGENITKPRRYSNIIWTYYVSPSLSYRYLSDEVNNFVIHKPRIGYEAGTEMSFPVFKNLRFTTGLQLNYSGYKIRATNAHPTVATLILNAETIGQSNVYSTESHYGNSSSTDFTRLKNYSFQASIPIGLQYVFSENNNIKFGAAATFQPSFIIAKQAYLLSSDKRNYLTAPDLLRNWNMNTSFSTFVSFSSNSYNWQDRKSTRLNSSHPRLSRMPSSA